MYRFSATIHGLPTGPHTRRTVDLDGQPFNAVCVHPSALQLPLGTSFEQSAELLGALPGLFFEPDGSFVWASPAGVGRWQVEGCVYDRDGRLVYVDLKGACPERHFDQLLAAFGWPATPLVFQLTRQAVYLEETDFRRFAKRSHSGR